MTIYWVWTRSTQTDAWSASRVPYLIEGCKSCLSDFPWTGV